MDLDTNYRQEKEILIRLESSASSLVEKQKEFNKLFEEKKELEIKLGNFALKMNWDLSYTLKLQIKK